MEKIERKVREFIHKNSMEKMELSTEMKTKE